MLKSRSADVWITRAKECGWYGLRGEGQGLGGKNGKVAINIEEIDATNHRHSAVTDDQYRGVNHPVFLGQERIVSAEDNEYVRKILSREDYYNLVGQLRIYFSDYSQEKTFYFASTAISVGMLI